MLPAEGSESLDGTEWQPRFGASLKYSLLIGGSFLEHPGGEATPVPYAVSIVDRRHPVTAGISDFTAATEQYYMQVDPNNEVLASTRFSGEHIPWLEGTSMPRRLDQDVGQGRAFYSTIGHTLFDLQAASAGKPESNSASRFSPGSKGPTTADDDKTASADSPRSSSRHCTKPLTRPDSTYEIESTKSLGRP